MGAGLFVNSEPFDAMRMFTMCVYESKPNRVAHCVYRLRRVRMLSPPYQPNCGHIPGGDLSNCLQQCLYRTVPGFRNERSVKMKDDPDNVTRVVHVWKYRWFDDKQNFTLNCYRMCDRPVCDSTSYRMISRYVRDSKAVDHDHRVSVNIHIDLMSIMSQFVPKVKVIETIFQVLGVVVIWFGVSVLATGEKFMEICSKVIDDKLSQRTNSDVLFVRVKSKRLVIK